MTYTFSKIIRESMPPDFPEPFYISISFKLVLLKKKTLENNVKITPPLPFKILATLLSAEWQHFPNEGSKFRSKVALKDSLDCDAILWLKIPLQFRLLLQIIILKNAS